MTDTTSTTETSTTETSTTETTQVHVLAADLKPGDIINITGDDFAVALTADDGDGGVELIGYRLSDGYTASITGLDSTTPPIEVIGYHTALGDLQRTAAVEANGGVVDLTTGRVLPPRPRDADGNPIETPREPFKPGYAVLEGVRIRRARLQADDGGVATVAFRGQCLGMPWVQTGASGRMSLYTETDLNAGMATEYRVALVPTGKRVPSNAVRLGSSGRVHAYLLDTFYDLTPAQDEAPQAE